MTVAELIEILEKMPRDAKVVTWSDPYDTELIYSPDIGFDTEVGGKKGKFVYIEANIAAPIL